MSLDFESDDEFVDLPKADEFADLPEEGEYRAGFVAVVGKPNVVNQR